MSALLPKADIAERGQNVRMVPNADIKSRHSTTSDQCRFMPEADIRASPSDVRYTLQNDKVNAVANRLYIMSVNFFWSATHSKYFLEK
jgi:hypothetical protein